MKRCYTAVALVAILVMLMSCADIKSGDPLSTVTSVDLARYSGTWYEIARLPMWFQRHCVDSTATYTPRPDGLIGVHNECVTDKGDIDKADGVATIIDTKTNARLGVVFDNWFAKLVGSPPEGNYWILDLDAEYRTALVGTPNRRYLWILCRTPVLDESTYLLLVKKAEQLGFSVSNLIRTKRDSPKPVSLR
jgi:apolipoprotein D and lipocalin family protein